MFSLSFRSCFFPLSPPNNLDCHRCTGRTSSSWSLSFIWSSGHGRFIGHLKRFTKTGQIRDYREEFFGLYNKFSPHYQERKSIHLRVRLWSWQLEQTAIFCRGETKGQVRFYGVAVAIGTCGGKIIPRFCRPDLNRWKGCLSSQRGIILFYPHVQQWAWNSHPLLRRKH